MSKLKFGKLLYFSLALASVFTLSSCNNDSKELKGNRGFQGVDTSYLDYIGIEDMEGYNFRIYCRSESGMLADQYVE